MIIFPCSFTTGKFTKKPPMDKFMIEIFTSLISSAALTSILLWLTKSWISERLKNSIKSEYDQKLETHKAQLKCTTDTEIEKIKNQLKYASDVEVERLKSQLSITANEHNVLFSRLQEKRASTIAKTYSLLSTVIDAVTKHVKPSISSVPTLDLPEDDKIKHRDQVDNIADSVESFRSFKNKNQIFIPKTTVEKLNKIDEVLISVTYSYNFLSNDPASISPEFSWAALYPDIRKKITIAQNELEDEFRKLLGDKS